MGIRGGVLDIRVRPHEDEAHPTEPICSNGRYRPTLAIQEYK